MTGQAHEASASWSKLVAVAIQSMRDLKVDEDKVNVDGGAIAMGHPLGMSGARLVLHLAHALKSRGGGLGVASLWRRLGRRTGAAGTQAVAGVNEESMRGDVR